MGNDVNEQMAAILGFVIYHLGGEVKIPMSLFQNPPEEEMVVEAVVDSEGDELVIRLVPVDKG